MAKVAQQVYYSITNLAAINTRSPFYQITNGIGLLYDTLRRGAREKRGYRRAPRARHICCHMSCHVCCRRRQQIQTTVTRGPKRYTPTLVKVRQVPLYGTCKAQRRPSSSPPTPCERLGHILRSTIGATKTRVTGTPPLRNVGVSTQYPCGNTKHGGEIPRDVDETSQFGTFKCVLH